MVTTNQPTNRPNNQVNVEQVCSWNNEQRRLLQATETVEELVKNGYMWEKNFCSGWQRNFISGSRGRVKNMT